MVNLHLYWVFILTTTALMLIPGPNVALITANSVAHGTRYGLLTVLGTSAAMVVQLGLVALGLTALLGRMSSLFEVLRWMGAAYLIGLGLSRWFARSDGALRTGPQAKSARAIFLRGFLVSLTNPKTLFFYGAFFPQFVVPGAAVAGQIAELSVTFLGIALLVDGGWALLAGALREWIAPHERLSNRLTGGVLVAAGLSLALVRRR